MRSIYATRHGFRETPRWMLVAVSIAVATVVGIVVYNAVTGDTYRQAVENYREGIEVQRKAAAKQPQLHTTR